MAGYNYFLWLTLFLLACEAEPVSFTLQKPSQSDRTVLVEEFSGALCPNCPQGTQELDNLKAIYGENLIIVAVHAGDFAFMFPHSKYDFTTPEGDQLLRLLGNPIGYPSAVINRVANDAGNFQIFSSRWGSAIQDALNEGARINLSLEHSYIAENRALSVKVTALPLEDIEGAIRLVVLLKESDIIDPQADRAAASGVVEDYNHKNVLRTMLTPVEGDLLADRVTAFEPLVKAYEYILPEEDGWWVDSNCDLVAFIALSDRNSIEILQAVEVPVRP